tara:strand:- start:81 stop:311 length:231 start_codon:yes stop_codon:yes gene_type:complete
MAERVAVNVAALCGAALGGAIVVAADARATAYLPLPLGAALSTRPRAFAAACVAAFGVPLLGTLACRWWWRGRPRR